MYNTHKTQKSKKSPTSTNLFERASAPFETGLLFQVGWIKLQNADDTAINKEHFIEDVFKFLRANKRMNDRC